jgi:peptidyl-tRNA hydrolase, PTH1 family
MIDKETKHLVYVGLGNPGQKYRKTRHNIGFMVIDRFAEKHDWELKEVPRFQSKVAKGAFDDITAHLLEPAAYMNLSGHPLRKYLNYFHLGPDSVVVVTDDAALPFGEMRFRLLGSSGGHNGLKSVEQHLGTRNYARLRMGIAGKHYGQQPLEDYVLQDFSREETDELPNFIEQAASVLERLLTEDPERVMNDVNTKVKNKDDSEPTKTL